METPDIVYLVIRLRASTLIKSTDKFDTYSLHEYLKALYVLIDMSLFGLTYFKLMKNNV